MATRYRSRSFNLRLLVLQLADDCPRTGRKPGEEAKRIVLRIRKGVPLLVLKRCEAPADRTKGRRRDRKHSMNEIDIVLVHYCTNSLSIINSRVPDEQLILICGRPKIVLRRVPVLVDPSQYFVHSIHRNGDSVANHVVTSFALVSVTRQSAARG